MDVYFVFVIFSDISITSAQLDGSSPGGGKRGRGCSKPPVYMGLKRLGEVENENIEYHMVVLG